MRGDDDGNEGEGDDQNKSITTLSPPQSHPRPTTAVPRPTSYPTFRVVSPLASQAILNDCADAIQLTTLAVAWGELAILEDVLERTAANIGNDSVGISLALQLALLRRDARMVGVLIDFNATPRHIELERFFTRARRDSALVIT